MFDADAFIGEVSWQTNSIAVNQHWEKQKTFHSYRNGKDWFTSNKIRNWERKQLRQIREKQCHVKLCQRKSGTC